MENIIFSKIFFFAGIFGLTGNWIRSGLLDDEDREYSADESQS